MSARESATSDRRSGLSRSELVALGRTTITELLAQLGCTVAPPGSRLTGRLEVRTPSGGSVELFVSTQRPGGYAFWTKRRFVPAGDRFAAIVLLGDADEPDVYLMPSIAWRTAAPPLTDRDSIGKRSEPEYGVSLARSALPALERYRWDDRSAATAFR